MFLNPSVAHERPFCCVVFLSPSCIPSFLSVIIQKWTSLDQLSFKPRLSFVLDGSALRDAVYLLRWVSERITLRQLAHIVFGNKWWKRGRTDDLYKCDQCDIANIWIILWWFLGIILQKCRCVERMDGCVSLEQSSIVCFDSIYNIWHVMIYQSLHCVLVMCLSCVCRKGTILFILCFIYYLG